MSVSSLKKLIFTLHKVKCQLYLEETSKKLNTQEQSSTTKVSILVSLTFWVQLLSTIQKVKILYPDKLT